MAWYITDGVLQRADAAPAENSILTDITGEGAVVVPNGVTSIGAEAFDDCQSLTSIVFPDSLTSIGNWAFCRCWRLTSIVLPDGVTSIGRGALKECSSLTSIVLPDSLTSIGNGAFYECKSLTSIEIPNGVTSIGNNMFCGCLNLTSIKFPDSLTSIEAEAFLWCRSLTSIVLPDGVTSIGAEAFYWCEGLKNIELPDSLISIGSRIFYCCRSLTSITLPDRLKRIGESVFCGCDRLTSIVLSECGFAALSEANLRTLKAIACPISPKGVSDDVRVKLCAGFALCPGRYSETLRGEYIASIKRHAHELCEGALDYPELLHLMCREKLIGSKAIGQFVDEAINRGDIEATAILLSYQAEMLKIEEDSEARAEADGSGTRNIRAEELKLSSITEEDL